jgi:hypothetical protein
VSGQGSLSDTAVGAKTVRSFAVVDDMPADLRECVHDYGFAIVTACTQVGVRDPKRIRQLVREIWAGARQGGQRSGTEGTLGWLLALNGGALSYRTLVRVLADNNLTITPLFPTRRMLAASLAAVSGFNVRCTREEKHRRRLHAALVAARDEMLAEVEIVPTPPTDTGAP